LTLAWRRSSGRKAEFRQLGAFIAAQFDDATESRPSGPNCAGKPGAAR
jgi:hypothetical protein